MKNDLKFIGFCGLLSAALLSGCSDGAQTITNPNLPQISGMKAEYVPAGEEAIIYGSKLADAEVYFETEYSNDSVKAKVVSSEDGKIVFVVPDRAVTGKIKVKNSAGVTTSNFWFRDKRNIIIDFDSRIQTWGGIVPFDENGNLVQGRIEKDTIIPYMAKLDKGCSGKFGLLHGEYSAKTPYVYKNDLWFQYMYAIDEGGRGDFSVAGVFAKCKVEELVFKFECNIPKEAAYKGITTEFVLGYKSVEPDKIGREIAPVCRWEPYKNNGGYSVAGNNVGKDLSNGFYTDGWETISIPLTEFNYLFNEDTSRDDLKVNLKRAVNFSMLVFGKAEANTDVMIACDNFRIVPMHE